MAEEQKNPEEENTNEVEETVDEVVSEVEETAEEAVETVEQASVEAEVGAEMVAEDAEDAAESIVDDAEDMAEDLEDRVEAVGEKVEDFVENLEDRLEDAAEKVEDFVEDTVDDIKERAEDLFDGDDDQEAKVQKVVAEAEANAESALETLEDEAVSTEFMVAAEELVDDDGHHGDELHYTDDVVLPYFGHVATMPGGIYTFIFGVLGVITVVEVLMTEILPENAFTIFLLVVLSLAKAYLVIMYYMHLNNDNPLYRVVILLPLLVVLVSVLYLLGVPIGAGLGYN